MLSNNFSKGVLLTCIASIFWGLPQPLFFNELNHINTLEVVLHRGLWSFLFLFLILIFFSNLSEFVQIFKSKKKLFILTITATLIASNWGGFIFAVGQERVQDASMGYFITPMISIILGYLFLKENLSLIKIFSVFLMIFAIIFLFINLNKMPYLILLIGSTWAIYGLLRKQVNVSPSIGLLYESFVITLISLPYLIYLFVNSESSFLTVDYKTTFFLILTGAVTIFPLFFFNSGIKFIQLGLAGVLFYLAPSFHFITSVFILGEDILTAKLISFIIIWLGILLYIYSTFKERIIENKTQ
ncbi:EamA family transporter [Pelagibacteraceae bacterium]|nr:EamA family transporter [Pelagibacteraceae bacterium]